MDAALIQPVVDFLFVLVLMVVGSWLERFGGNDGFMDWFLTPLPLGVTGLLVVMGRGML